MLFAVNHQQFYLRIIEYEGDVVGPVVHKHRHGHQPVRKCTLVGHNPVDAIAQHHCQALAGLHSIAAQPLAHARSAVAGFAPVNPFPFLGGAVVFPVCRRVR